MQLYRIFLKYCANASQVKDKKDEGNEEKPNSHREVYGKEEATLKRRSLVPKNDGEVADGIVAVEHNDEDEDNEDDDDDVEDDDDDVSMGGTTNAPDGAVDVVSADCCKEQEACNDDVDVVDCVVIEEFDVETLKSLLLFWYAGIVSGVLGT
ncbi:hypothetical protein FF38_11930 [Lucilia cuprina]|uniref:Uncharacterized protein n=1 Tax=Lucilia cuprina TaxID=7375 RepID=A0A0L0C0N5_LUCCU|nr:hypothetical protein FF38_11930 [Lucilia cuprina]